MASTPFPTPYSPSPSPNLPGGDNKWLTKEFRNIQTTLAGVLTLLPQAAVAPPASPLAGMIRHSEAPWRPLVGQTTDQWVQYLGGSWVAFP